MAGFRIPAAVGPGSVVCLYEHQLSYLDPNTLAPWYLELTLLSDAEGFALELIGDRSA